MTTKQKTAQEWFVLALQHYGQERYRQAMHAHQQVKRLDPGGFHDSMLDGMHLFLADRFEEALASYERAISRKPEESLAHAHRGVVLMCLQRDDEALVAFEEALRLDPGNSVALTQMGNVYLFLKRYGEALELADRVLAGREPDEALQAMRVRTGALYNLGRYDEALEGAERIIGLAPRKVFGYAAKADTLEQLGHLEEALVSYEQALHRDPGNTALWNRTGAVLLRLGRPADALAAYERAQRLEEDLVSLNGKGVALLEMRRLVDALDAFEHALLTHPGDPLLLDNRSLVLQAMQSQEGQPRRRLRLYGAGALLGWGAAVTAVVCLALVLLAHPDLLLLPVEVPALLLYPLVCWLGWRGPRGHGFQRLLLRWLPLSVLPDQVFVWRRPRAEDSLLKLMRADLVGVLYLLVVAWLIQRCLSLLGGGTDPFSAWFLLGVNLLLLLHTLLVILAGLLFCVWPLLSATWRLLVRFFALVVRSGSRRGRAAQEQE